MPAASPKAVASRGVPMSGLATSREATGMTVEEEEEENEQLGVAAREVLDIFDRGDTREALHVAMTSYAPLASPRPAVTV